MAAVIQFPDGTQATYREGRGWSCQNATMQAVLDLRTEFLPPNYRPSPEADTAAEVAALAGALVVSSEPSLQLAPDDAEY